MADFGSTPAFRIVESTGKKRGIRLMGRGLPYKPLEFSTNQRVEVTWLPGTPSGTATILGPTEGETMINGVWKRRFIDSFAERLDGESPPIQMDGAAVRFEDVIPLFDEICRIGGLLEVVWGDEIRFGFLATFRRRWLDVNDVEWEMQFKWISRRELPGNPLLSLGSMLGDLDAGLKTKLGELGNISVPSGFSLDFGFLGVIQDLQHALEDAVNFATETVQQVTNKVISVVRSTRGLVSTFVGMEEAAENLVAYVDSQFGQEFDSWAQIVETGSEVVLPKQAAMGSSLAFVDMTEAEKLEVAIFKQALKSWANSLKYEAALQKSLLKDGLGGDVYDIATVKEGQDLGDVAAQFLGSPFEWQQLMIFNDLSSKEVPPGTVVFVPKLPLGVQVEAPGCF